MNKEEILIEYGHLSWDELPTSVREQIGDCQETKAWFEQVAWMQKALRVKQHELPSPEAEGRMQHRIETRIANMDRAAYEREESGSWISRNWPSLAFATAGVAVGVMALQFAIPSGTTDPVGSPLAITDNTGPGVSPISTAPFTPEAGLPIDRTLGGTQLATNSLPRSSDTLPAGNP